MSKAFIDFVNKMTNEGFKQLREDLHNELVYGSEVARQIKLYKKEYLMKVSQTNLYKLIFGTIKWME